MRSMTGYGKASARVKNLNIRIEARSVNHRFFNCQLGLPEILSDSNARIEAIVRQYIPRGSINLSIKIEPVNQKPVYEFNIPVIREYHNRIKVLQKKLGLKDQLSINTLLNLPGIQQLIQLNQAEIKPDWAGMERVIASALKNLVNMRSREGNRLKKALQAILNRVQSLKEEVRKRIPEVKKQYQEALSKRVIEILSKIKADISGTNNGTDANNINQRIAEEVAFFAQKIDITEEINRLESHLEEFRKTINQDGEAGKKLDFLTQEILREVNTMASKGNDSKISHYTIALKMEIDRLKEQVQNIE
jgi:uncharacterized protein (TIGR00255 family)